MSQSYTGVYIVLWKWLVFAYVWAALTAEQPKVIKLYDSKLNPSATHILVMVLVV